MIRRENMQMTIAEIAGSYRRATNQRAQIGILAELNSCDKEEIIKILEGQGIKVKRSGRPKGRKAIEGKEKPQEAAVEEGERSEEPQGAAVGESEPPDEMKGAAVVENQELPDIVKQAITRELIATQELIDAAKADLTEAEEKLKRYEADMEILNRYMRGEAI